MVFLHRTVGRLPWPLGLAHGSSFVYFSPSLTPFRCVVHTLLRSTTQYITFHLWLRSYRQQPIDDN